MEIDFKGNARCISYEKNNDKFKDEGCTSKKYLVCQLTCCKSPFTRNLVNEWLLILIQNILAERTTECFAPGYVPNANHDFYTLYYDWYSADHGDSVT